jgi:transposase InsO family protein
MAVINAKRVYRIMRQNALLLERKPEIPPSKRAHTGKVAVGESNQRWCSDGFEFSCDNGEKLRVTFALDCCDREALYWAASNGGYDSETVQDVMLGAVERRFGNSLPTSPVEWLTDNGSAYRSYQTRQFARMVGLEPKHTAVQPGKQRDGRELRENDEARLHQHHAETRRVNSGRTLRRPSNITTNGIRIVHGVSFATGISAAANQ